MELYLCVLLGAFIYLAFTWNEVFTKPEFKWGIFLKQNLGPTIINLTIGFALVWRKEDIKSWLPITGIIAIFLGTSGQVIWKKVSNMLSTRIDTFIGINK